MKNPGGSTGEGISIAYQAGARIADMEFVQFHPTAFYSEGGESFLISEAVRGEGASLLNTRGRRFMQDYSEQGELAPRDVVSRAIFKEMEESGKDYVYLDLKHLDAYIIKSRFQNIYNLAVIAPTARMSCIALSQSPGVASRPRMASSNTTTR